MTEKSPARPAKSVLIYVAIVHLITLATMAWLWRAEAAGHGIPLAPLSFWLVFTLASELFWLETPSGGGMVSMSLAVNIATLYLLPPFWAAAVVATATLIADLVIHRRGGLKAFFNASQTALTIAGCTTLTRALGGDPTVAPATYLVREPLAVIVGPVLFFFLNTGIVSGVIGLSSGVPFFRAWRQNYGYGYQVLSSGTLSLLGLVLVVSVGSIGYISGLLYLVFFFFVRDAYHRYVQSRRERQSESIQASPVTNP
jgi:hypothetical protein